MEQEASTPKQEAVIAAAGPIASLLLGGVLVAADLVIRHPQIDAVVGWLGIINLTLGAFNLIPGFPMDGGRILRAILWRVRGEKFAATRTAAAVGRLFGYLLIGGGVWIAFQTGGLFGGIWLALIGWFLSSAAESTVAQMSVQRTLHGVKVRDVMDPEPATVSPNESVSDLVNQRLMRGEHRSFLVRHADGGLAGIVTLSDVGRVPRENWDGARVTDIMTRWSDLARVGPDEEVDAALDVLRQREVNQLPVVEADGRTVVGLLTRAGILRMIDTRLKLGV
jgi:CBS domain-containing protein